MVMRDAPNKRVIREVAMPVAQRALAPRSCSSTPPDALPPPPPTAPPTHQRRKLHHPVHATQPHRPKGLAKGIRGAGLAGRHHEHQGEGEEEVDCERDAHAAHQRPGQVGSGVARLFRARRRRVKAWTCESGRWVGWGDSRGSACCCARTHEREEDERSGCKHIVQAAQQERAQVGGVRCGERGDRQHRQQHQVQHHQGWRVCVCVCKCERASPGTQPAAAGCARTHAPVVV